MKNIFLLGLSLITSLYPKQHLHSQTFNSVVNVLQNNCTVGCHSGANPSAGLDLSGSTTQVYNRLVNIDPINPFALSKGYKLIDPGYPETSFLFRKINDGLNYEHIELETAEGSKMPPSPQPSLSKKEIDLLNTWILYGAPQNTTVIDEQLLTDFYDNNLGIQTIERPTPPATGEGIQIHLGGIFLAPGQEIEVKKKHLLKTDQPIDVKRLETFMVGESHHFILYKFDSSAVGNYNEGIRVITQLQDAFTAGANFVGVWQYSKNFDLPNGTAYKWETAPYLDLNFHLRNYSLDSVLRAEVYTNIYFEDQTTENTEMFTKLFPYPTSPLPCPFPTFCIPNDATDHTYGGGVFDSNSQDSLYVWLLTSHTHSLGKDFDVYLRNTNGSNGDKIYEGFYDYENDFNLGFYDYHHPPTRFFEPLFPIAEATGFNHYAIYNNNTSANVSWGLSTHDEMMITIMQYTLEKPKANANGITYSLNENYATSIYPNPSKGAFNVKIQGSEPILPKLIKIYNLLGEEIPFSYQIKSQEIIRIVIAPKPSHQMYFIEYQNNGLGKIILQP